MEDVVEVIDARGSKRTCQNPQCGMRFYDLNRTPMICPYCETPYIIASAPPKREAVAEKPKPVEAKTEEKTEEDSDVELVSLEDAEVDVDDDDAEDTFLEEDDDDSSPDVAVTVADKDDES
ncbi:MAG: TIGR02300 family protein [Pseudomonadota bacterium]